MTRKVWLYDSETGDMTVEIKASKLGCYEITSRLRQGNPGFEFRAISADPLSVVIKKLRPL